jgi:hypothetical protein
MKRFFCLSGLYITAFYLYILWRGYNIISMFSFGPYEGFGYSILGGSLSNVFLFFISMIDGSLDMVFFLFFLFSLLHVLSSCFILNYLWQFKTVKWRGAIIWVGNCSIWFFMGDILPSLMRI